jgi:replicative DNA helicase
LTARRFVSDFSRVPPHSVEAEQAVLGGLMLAGNAWEQIADKLVEEDFYRYDHRLIFRAAVNLNERNQPVDVVTLNDWLDAQNLSTDSGGAGYLLDLANNTPSAANIVAYAQIVREKSVLRQLIDIGTDIAGNGFNPEGRESRELLEWAEQQVFRIAEQGGRNRSGFLRVQEVLKDVFRGLEERGSLEGGITGTSTGFTDLDEQTSGLQKSDLIIVAGRPSMGKTSFAMNIAEYVALKTKRAVAVFSMEMSGVQLLNRMLCSLGKINQQRFRNGSLDDQEWYRLTSTAALLNESKIFIDETPALSPAEVRARCRRLKREHDVSMVVVDYLQLMQVPGTKENRTNEISEISRGLKALAKELNVPVIALSQLNRKLEERTDKRPVMADLRESGAIEQDADLILFIYRDEVYHKDSAHKGKAEIIIAKQRNGPIGTVNLAFNGMYTRFDNFTPEVFMGAGSFDG